jgi:hypothetical protein
MKAWAVCRWCLRVPWNMLKWLIAGGRRLPLPARVWVLCVLLVIAALVAYTYPGRTFPGVVKTVG